MTKMTGNTPILLIESHWQEAEETQANLVMQGYDVEWKCSGIEGWTFAQTSDFSLLVIGAQLSDGSAFQWCQQIRQASLWQPILVLSPFPDELDQVLCLELGADDYLTRPYQAREFIARIRALLRRTYNLFHPNQSFFHIGDLIIDRQRGQVRRNQQLLNLTPTEFRLLAVLAEHLGQTLTRSQIIDQVWGYQVDMSNEETVNVHICRLRQKVERDPLQPTLIQTVPGMGYRLADEKIDCLIRNQRSA